MRLTASTAIRWGPELSKKILLVGRHIIAPMRFRRAGLFLILGFCALTQGAASAERAQHRPLLLDQGTLRGHQWTVGLMRDVGKQGGQRPCLVNQIGEAPQTGLGETDFSGETKLKSCSALTPAALPNELSLTIGDGNREITVFGIAFAPQVTSAYLEFGPDEYIRVKLKKLNSVQTRNAGVRSIRYAAFALKGNRCVRQIKSYGASGNELFRSPVVECPEQGA